ncbi:membrane protein, partial [Candidatus Magnetoovum chiemensis]
MFFLYLCYAAHFALLFLAGVVITFEYYEVIVIIMFMGFIAIFLGFVIYLILNFKRLCVNSDLAAGIFAFEKTYSDTVKMDVSGSYIRYFLYLCFFSSFVGFLILLAAIHTSFDILRVVVSLVVSLGSLTIVHYLI